MIEEESNMAWQRGFSVKTAQLLRMKRAWSLVGPTHVPVACLVSLGRDQVGVGPCLITWTIFLIYFI